MGRAGAGAAPRHLPHTTAAAAAAHPPDKLAPWRQSPEGLSRSWWVLAGLALSAAAMGRADMSS